MIAISAFAKVLGRRSEKSSKSRASFSQYREVEAPASLKNYAHLLGDHKSRGARADHAHGRDFADQVEAAAARAESRAPRAQMLDGPRQAPMVVTGDDILRAARAANKAN
jgi:hypothetical protein